MDYVFQFWIVDDAVRSGSWQDIAGRFVLWLLLIYTGWVRGAIIAALTGALYLTLPIVVYERKGPLSAFRSTWRNVRQTWGGLVVGTGLLLSGVWLALWFIGYVVKGMLEGMLDVDLVTWTALLVFQLVMAVVLYCVNITLSSNLRAALYLHVTEGRTGVIPAGAFANAPTPPSQGGEPTTFEIVS
ncbi:MAG: hypothetical protein WDA16_04470 [Candidatus Thermoplasmatota archaeon]